MRESLKIGVDIDGVLADFNTAYINLLLKLTNEDKFPARPFDIPCWFYPEHFGYSKDQISSVWDEIIINDTFWETLKPYADTAECIDLLHGRSIRGDYVYYITSRPGTYAKQQTENWLKVNNSLRLSGWREYVPTVIITNEKGAAAKLLDLDYYIDDKIENCEDVASSSSQTYIYMLDQPWNRRDSRFTGIKRISSPLDMLREI